MSPLTSKPSNSGRLTAEQYAQHHQERLLQLQRHFGQEKGLLLAVLERLLHLDEELGNPTGWVRLTFQGWHDQLDLLDPRNRMQTDMSVRKQLSELEARGLLRIDRRHSLRYRLDRESLEKKVKSCTTYEFNVQSKAG